MSEQVQSIVEAFLRLGFEQRRELTAAPAAIDVSRPSDSSSKKQLVDSIRGKYRHLPTSSELFMNRKKEDTALESRP
jgi:hypothetical protein